MRIILTVKPNSKYEKVEEALDGSIKVFIKEPARDGLANNRLVSVLANYYNVHKKDISIVSGLGSRNKLIDVKI